MVGGCPNSRMHPLAHAVLGRAQADQLEDTGQEATSQQEAVIAAREMERQRR